MQGRAVRVVGAGPAGLMAAQVLAESGIAVTILDHKPAAGRKFLLAGRGGLNLTHSEPLEKLLGRYGPARARLEPALRAFPPEAVIRWCENLGVKTFVGSSGRIFPASLKASPLLRAWLRHLGQLGVRFQGNTQWQGFDETETILALGGASWPELGSDAAWVPVFQRAGIAVSPFLPSNVRQSVAWSAHFAERFAGLPIKNVSVSVAGSVARGELMISRDGIEGGAIYALSPHLRSSADISVDLKPDLSEDTVRQRLAQPRGKDSLSNVLRKRFGLPPVAIALMREAGASNPKHVALSLLGPKGLARAISSAGGVAWDEVDDEYRLRKFPHVRVVGEMLDWDAPTGGYLLQACLATAHMAASACVRRFQESAA